MYIRGRTVIKGVALSFLAYGIAQHMGWDRKIKEVVVERFIASELEEGSQPKLRPVK